MFSYYYKSRISITSIYLNAEISQMYLDCDAAESSDCPTDPIAFNQHKLHL